MIAWNGGECPVSWDSRVKLILRNGIFVGNDLACNWDWKHFAIGKSPSYDIVFYEVVE